MYDNSTWKTIATYKTERMKERFKVAVTPQWSTGANTLGVDIVVNLPVNFNFDNEQSDAEEEELEEEGTYSSRFHHSAMRPPPEALSAPLNTHVSHDWLICRAFTWKAFFNAFKRISWISKKRKKKYSKIMNSSYYLYYRHEYNWLLPTTIRKKICNNNMKRRHPTLYNWTNLIHSPRGDCMGAANSGTQSDEK